MGARRVGRTYGTNVLFNFDMLLQLDVCSWVLVCCMPNILICVYKTVYITLKSVCLQHHGPEWKPNLPPPHFHFTDNAGSTEQCELWSEASEKIYRGYI